MAHFAKIDENNIVTQVVVVDNKDTSDAEGVEKEHIGAAHLEKILGGTWKQTSYNGNMRKNYAGIGYTYRADIDAFVPSKPFPSWLLGLWVVGVFRAHPFPLDQAAISRSFSQAKPQSTGFSA